MRVVITGASGNVGTSLITALADEDRVTEVLGVARRRPDWGAPKTSWVTADVASDDLVAIFRGADVVVHLAWLFQPTRVATVTWRVNVLGSIRVFDAAAQAGVGALVHASSVGAYSPGPVEGAVDESWPTHALPTAAYGREKSYVERLLDNFELEHPDIRVVRLRPGFIFKREAASAQRRLFLGPFFPNSLARRELVPVFPDMPGLRFQVLHSTDVAAAYRLAIVRPVAGPFNVAADPVIDVDTLASFLGARPVKVPVRAARLAMAAAWRLHLAPPEPGLLDLALSLPVMDTARARDELGWSARYSALDALDELLEGLQHGAGMGTPPLEPGRSARNRSTPQP